jgi:hypothetical protein
MSEDRKTEDGGHPASLSRATPWQGSKAGNAGKARKKKTEIRGQMSALDPAFAKATAGRQAHGKKIEGGRKTL